jgi:hypothetical protein
LTAKTTPRKQTATLGVVPELIVNGLLSLYPGPVTASRLNDVTCVPVPEKKKWASAAAEKSYHEIEEWVSAKVEANREFKPFLERVQENAVRLATIHAAGRWSSDDFVVDLSDIQWGGGIAKISGDQLARDALSQMDVTLTHTELFNKIMKTIADNGGWASEFQIKRAMPKSVRKKDRADMVANLLDRELIKLEMRKPPTGRPSPGYALV